MVFGSLYELGDGFMTIVDLTDEPPHDEKKKAAGDKGSTSGGAARRGRRRKGGAGIIPFQFEDGELYYCLRGVAGTFADMGGKFEVNDLDELWTAAREFLEETNYGPYYGSPQHGLSDEEKAKAIKSVYDVLKKAKECGKSIEVDLPDSKYKVIFADLGPFGIHDNARQQCGGREHGKREEHTFEKCPANTVQQTANHPRLRGSWIRVQGTTSRVAKAKGGRKKQACVPPNRRKQGYSKPCQTCQKEKRFFFSGKIF